MQHEGMASLKPTMATELSFRRFVVEASVVPPDVYRATLRGEGVIRSSGDSPFGDFELVVRDLFDNDTKLLEKINSLGPGGFQVIKNKLNNDKVDVPNRIVEVLRSLRHDQEFAEAAEDDTAGIETRGGSYRVVVMFEGERYRRSFKCLSDAQKHRDKWQIFKDSYALSLG